MYFFNPQPSLNTIEVFIFTKFLIPHLHLQSLIKHQSKGLGHCLQTMGQRSLKFGFFKLIQGNKIFFFKVSSFSSLYPLPIILELGRNSLSLLLTGASTPNFQAAHLTRFFNSKISSVFLVEEHNEILPLVHPTLTCQSRFMLELHRG